MYIKKLIYPELYQGKNKKDRYFEGWYYKLVSQDELTTLAFIPGISKNKHDPHVFIQVFMSKKDGDHVSLKTSYFRFSHDDFSYGHDVFFVKIKDNYFSKHQMTINLHQDDIDIKGTLKIEGITPIKRHLFMPNIMGFFGYFNFMECYHGVISMTHRLSGLLTYNQKTISFDGAKGYIEKDWGTSFPRNYVWLQSNHFKNEKTSLMFSFADIPFLGFYFKGLIANLYYEGKEYRFATYNGARVKKETILDKAVYYHLKKGRYSLIIEAKSTTEIALASPKNGSMIEQIKEGLSGTIHIKLFDRKVLLYEDVGMHAGIEIMK